MKTMTSRRNRFACRILSAFIAFAFSFTSVLPPAYAQSIASLNLPVPGAMVMPTPAFVPVLLKGMTIHPDNPLQFDFIIDSGNTDFKEDQIKEESQRLVKYFLASMTIPKDDLWVNLSPYESDKIVPDELGKTELGRDMLAQDYILKQLTASLMYPEKELGKEFWDKVYKLAKEKYGTTEIPVNTFNKVWILPETATVYEHGQTVYIVEAKLKVMLDSDYLAQSHQVTKSQGHQENVTGDPVTTEIVREVILPAIEREVNEGQNFAPLRQIYHSLILAKWYKETIKNSLLSKVYVDKKLINGIRLEDGQLKGEDGSIIDSQSSIVDQIYNQYMEAYKKGVFNYIKEDYDRLSNETIPRKYFSGGFKGDVEIDRTASRNGIEGSAVGENYQLTMEVSPQKDGVSSPIRLGELMVGRKMSYFELEDSPYVLKYISDTNYPEIVSYGFNLAREALGDITAKFLILEDVISIDTGAESVSHFIIQEKTTPLEQMFNDALDSGNFDLVKNILLRMINIDQTIQRRGYVWTDMILSNLGVTKNNEIVIVDATEIVDPKNADLMPPEAKRYHDFENQGYFFNKMGAFYRFYMMYKDHPRAVTLFAIFKEVMNMPLDESFRLLIEDALERNDSLRNKMTKGALDHFNLLHTHHYQSPVKMVFTEEEKQRFLQDLLGSDNTRTIMVQAFSEHEEDELHGQMGMVEIKRMKSSSPMMAKELKSQIAEYRRIIMDPAKNDLEKNNARENFESVLAIIRRDISLIEDQLNDGRPADPVRVQQIDNLIAQIRSGQFELKGEAVDVLRKPTEEQVNALRNAATLKEGEVIIQVLKVQGTMDRDIAEKGLGYFHQTANAFILTPEVKILNQVRVPWKKFGLFESIYGGHLSAGQGHASGISRELLEELGLSERQQELSGELKFAGFDVFEDSKNKNMEVRSLFSYKLTPAEWSIVEEEIAKLAKARKIAEASVPKNLSSEERNKALEKPFKNSLNAQGSGLGEVWDIKIVTWDQLDDASKLENYTPDLLRPILRGNNHLKDKVRIALGLSFDASRARKQLKNILYGLQWWTNSPFFTREDAAVIRAVEKDNWLAGPGVDNYGEDLEKEIREHDELSKKYNDAIETIESVINSRIDEIIKWAEQNFGNFNNEEVFVLDGEDGEDQDAKVIGKIDREIAKEFGFSYRKLGQSSSPMIEQGTGGRDQGSETAKYEVRTTKDVGGIDMNTIDLDREGVGVDIQFDLAQLQDIIDAGIDGFAPVIINITPLPSVLPLLGLDPTNKEEPLEVSVL